MPGITNRGKFKFLDWVFRRTTMPTNFYATLCTGATAPTVDTNTLSELTQIAVGNGYANGGIMLSPNATDFPTLTEDDANDRAALIVRNLVWTASGGSLPASGSGARWLALTDDNATLNSRDVLFYWDLQADRTVSSGQPLTIQSPEARITEGVPGITNRGKFKFLDWVFRRTTMPTNFYATLCTGATAPTADTNTLSELTQIAVGNGYANGGIMLSPNATDFPTLTEDDANDRAALIVRNLVWTASGGSLPASGSGARWLVLTDDNATLNSRDVLFYWDLQADRTVSNGQPLTIQSPEFRLVEV